MVGKYYCEDVDIYQVRNGQNCRSGGCLSNDFPLQFEATLYDKNREPYCPSFGSTLNLLAEGRHARVSTGVDSCSNGKVNATINLENNSEHTGVFNLTLLIGAQGSSYIENCSNLQVGIEAECGEDECSEEETTSHNLEKFKICDQIDGVTQNAQREACMDCLGEGEVAQGIWTAVGCIPTDTQGILQTTVKLGLFSGGGFALIMILFGAFNLSISQGDPKKISEAKDIITAAIIGLIFIIFSISILQFIGVELLRIPGFGT